MKNINDIIEGMTRVFHGLENGDIQPRTAGEMSNAVGKIIAAARMQVEYQRLKGEVPKVEFLEDGK